MFSCPALTIFKHLVHSYEQVYEGKQFCKNSSGDWTIVELESQRNDLTWYSDFGNGVCNITNNGGISACADICASIKDCVYFSTSDATPCFACFIYKTCNNPINIENSYKIYQISDQGNI